MYIQELFIKSFRVWFALLLATNLIGLIFINILDCESSSFSDGFAGIVSNLILAYLILFYNHFVVSRADPFYDDTKTFYQWIWFTKDHCTRVLIGTIFLIWLIPNAIMLSALQGILWLPGLHFILSIFYWTAIIIILFWSNFKQPQQSFDTV